MFPVVRLVGALAVFALVIGSIRAEDTDPVFEGEKVSKWVDIAQNDPSARKRSLAVEALGKIWVAHKHKDAIPNVCRSLRVDTSAAVRTQAALVLAGLRADDIGQGSKALIDTLGTEKESRVKKEIITAMLKFPAVCVEGVEPLIRALKDPEPAVKIAAAEALALAGVFKKMSARSAAPELVPLLKDSDKAVRMAAVYALSRVQPEGASTIAETMTGMLGTEKDADMKRELVTALGLLAEKSDVVLKALATTLFDPDDDLRRRAARVLGTFGTDAAPVADDLYKALTTDKLKDVRVDAVRAFGSALGPTGVKARVKDFLAQFDPAKQPDYEVRLALVEEVGALGYEHLGADLTSTNPAVKAAAQEVIGALRIRLSDPQVKVREAAGIAIRKIEKKPEPKKEDKKDPEKKDP
jgi:HEAT repeat protein